MIIRPIFAWYDFWIGIFFDSKERRLYLLPIPCCGVIIELGPEWQYGVLDNGLKARRHCTGRIEFLLWKKGQKQGDYIYTEDYWYPPHSDHWAGFKPTKPLINCDYEI